MSAEDKIRERVKSLRESKYPGHGGKSKFAHDLGISLRQYTRWEKENMPPPVFLAKVAELTGASLEWLVTGNIPEVKESAVVVPKIPLKDYRARAGLGPSEKTSCGADVGFLDNRDELPGENLFGVLCTGRSMEPLIPDGCFVICDPDKPPELFRACCYKKSGDPSVECKLLANRDREYFWMISCTPGKGQTEKITREFVEWIHPVVGIL